MSIRTTNKNLNKGAIERILANFQKTGKYSSEFLRDLKEGLIDLHNSNLWKSK